MSRLKHDVLLRVVKYMDVILMVCPFLFYCFWDCSENKNMAIVLGILAVVFYCVFGRIYEAFFVSIKKISEMIYSQMLAILVSDGMIYLLICILSRSFWSVRPFFIILFVQFLVAIVWANFANRWYFSIFPPKQSLIVYDSRSGLDEMIEKYRLNRKYEIKKVMYVDSLMKNLFILNNYQTVFISGVHSKERNLIMKYCVGKDIEAFVIPRIGDVLLHSAEEVHMFHIPMLQVKRYKASPEYLFVKRLMDIVIAGIALVILSPIMIVVAIVIKAYDGGPAFYSQVRLTKDGKKFNIHKFRSMRVDAEKDGVARLSTGDNDDRITPIGKVIRKLRFDELPQLLDILAGTLSIVGPRPERPEIAEEYEKELPEFALRLQAKAGLTGYAQVYGKYNTTPYDKLMMDLMYIANPSILEDIRLMFATVKILFMSDSTEGVQEGQTTASN